MPMYNAEDIVTNLKEATKVLNRVTSDYEIILVDDGSTNDCYKKAKEFEHEKIRVFRYAKNQGKGYAIKYCFNFVKGEYVAFVDSGRDLNPEQLKDFMKIMEKEQADIVTGSKRHPLSEVHYPLMRKFMSFSYQTINKILFNLSIKDTQVGLKLFKRGVLEKIMPRIAIKRFAFDLELLVLANKFKFKIVEEPIVMRYRFKSTIKAASVFWILWDTAAIFYRLKILRYYD